MPTRISLALGPRQPLSRQTAWGCFTTNLALPGFGSLVAGRVSGYSQALLSVGGMALTVVFGVRFIIWYFANWSLFHDAQTDPLSLLSALWVAVRWTLVGIGLFIAGWLWALATSLSLLREARLNDDKQSAGQKD